MIHIPINCGLYKQQSYQDRIMGLISILYMHLQVYLVLVGILKYIVAVTLRNFMLH